MSSDIYSKVDLSRKKRYTKEKQEDKKEWEEMDVDIYESADDVAEDGIDYHPQEEGKQLIGDNIVFFSGFFE